MATQFEFLAQAKPASLHKLLGKLSVADAAIVLTGLPHSLAIQVLAYFPDDKQAPMLNAMRDARGVSQELRQNTAGKIRSMLDAAKPARGGKTTGTPPPAAKVDNPPPPSATPGPKLFGMDPGASILSGSVPEEDFSDEPAKPPVIPLTPKFSPPRASSAGQPGQSGQQPPRPETAPAEQVTPAPPPNPRPAAANAMNFNHGVNPYAAAPAQEPPARREEARSPNSGERIGQVISELGEKIKKAFTPATEHDKTPEDGFRTKDPAASRSSAPGTGKKTEPRPDDFGKPVPWVPKAATSSPINGPALPGKPPPVVGDPFESPLAKAGLLDLIGRAQEKFLPKGTVQPPRPAAEKHRAPAAPRRPGAKPGRPEPREGVVRLDDIGFNKTPRVIGPRPKGEELLADDRVPASGVQRMDGKAILAAILRNATPEIRGKVRKDDPKLFKELRGRMFYFDDLIYTEDSALARVFTAAPADTAALALKFAAPKLRDRVLAAVSPGRAKALRDTPKKSGLDDIEAAQKLVLNVALQLQAAGRILIDPRDPDLAGG